MTIPAMPIGLAAHAPKIALSTALFCAAAVWKILPHSLDLARYFALLGGLALLYGSNLSIPERRWQWIFPILALLLLFVLWYFVLWGERTYGELILSHPDLANLLRDFMKTPIVHEALVVLNLFFLWVAGLIKLLLGGLIRTYFWWKARTGPRGAQIGYRLGAYECLSASGTWNLVPVWHFARHLGTAIAVLSVAAFVLYLLAIEKRWDPAWMPMFPVLAILLSAELAFYLGGEERRDSGVQLGGTVSDRTDFANYERVWQDMRRVWPEAWLSSANHPEWDETK